MKSRVPHCLLILVLGSLCVYGQEPAKDKAAVEEKTTPVTIVLASGNPLLVDEVSESADGYWYKRGNIQTLSIANESLASSILNLKVNLRRRSRQRSSGAWPRQQRLRSFSPRNSSGHCR